MAFSKFLHIFERKKNTGQKLGPHYGRGNAWHTKATHDTGGAIHDQDYCRPDQQHQSQFGNQVIGCRSFLKYFTTAVRYLFCGEQVTFLLRNQHLTAIQMQRFVAPSINQRGTIRKTVY